MDTRSVQAVPPRMTVSWRVVLGAVLLAMLAACETAVPSPSSSPSPLATLAAVRPTVRIDQEWTAANGDWTFTGAVDPQGDATDVVLDVGPGPATARVFDAQVPVAQAIATAGPLTITTRAIPDIKEICVRFSATNSGGSTSSSPLCFPHDLPSFAPPGAPSVTIDAKWTFADGAWGFTARLDPNRSPADLVLEIGRGPAAKPVFGESVPVGQDVAELATLRFSTTKIPDASLVCVRFTATNANGTASSGPLCFDPGGPPPS